MAVRSVTRIYDGALGEVGLRATSYAILSRLDSDGPLSIGNLADRLALDRTTCSRELDPLVESGLVQLDVGSDRRQRVAALSDAGAAKLAEARPLWLGVQGQVRGTYGEPQTADLLERLRELLSVSSQLAA
jgi:DNA-binding MarR family transcriptional regulator